MNHGRRGERIFQDNRDFKRFVDLLKESTELWNLRVSAYCLMPNHYHLLVQTPDANISRCMRHINGVYTQRYNRRHHCEGQLFRGRYKSILVDADSYLLQLVRYIHRNPLRAGLTDSLKKYDWSSHKGYLSSAARWSWLHKDYVLSMLSKDKANRLRTYRHFVAMSDEDGIIRVYERKQWPSFLGSEGFVNSIKEKFFSRKADEEVPQARDLAIESSRIRKTVCEFYKITERELLLSKRGMFNEPRNVAIYLTRRMRGDSLKEIAKEFGMSKYSSVSSAIERMKELVAKDRKQRKKVEKLESLLSKSQEQT
jgi:REP element-mobilizing transposase RayT